MSTTPCAPAAHTNLRSVISGPAKSSCLAMDALRRSTSIPPCSKPTASCRAGSRRCMSPSDAKDRRRKLGWRDLPLAYKGAFVVAIPLLCLVVQSVWLMLLHREEEDAAQWTAHTREVELEAQRLLTALVDGETADRGYVITHDPAFLAPYSDAERVIPETLGNLQSLVRDNPLQSARMNEIAGLAAGKLEIMHTIYGWKPSAQPSTDQVESKIQRGKTTMDALRAKLADFMAEENRLLGQRTARLEARRRYTNYLTWSGLVMGLVGGFAALWLFTVGVTQRLAVVQQNAERLAQELPLSAPVGGRDEIGQLEHELHRSS